MKKILILCIALIVSCTDEPIEKRFLHDERDRSNRIDKMRDFPFEVQYRIFIYGNQKMHPPQKSLAIPVAEHGKKALDYVLLQIEESDSDLDFRDSIIIFRAIQYNNHYDVCGDSSTMKKIRSNAEKIKFPGWKDYYQKSLKDMCV